MMRILHFAKFDFRKFELSLEFGESMIAVNYP